jgi:outer membrane protein assembly factor BamB
MTSSSVLCVGERLYVTTSNGRDWTNVHIPSPNAPALICLDAHTGKLLAQERSGISARTFKCNWSSPAYGVVNGQAMVFFGGDDGFCYAFDPQPVPGADGAAILREIWRFDCNPPEYRSPPGGAPFKYGHPRSPSGILATPVFHDGKVYIAIGQDPGQGEGIGALVCINAAAGTGDITRTGQVWMNKTIGRSLSTVAIADGLLYTADIAGKVYCLDLQTGAEVWKHDAEGAIWGSPLLADGKVYIGTETQTLWVLAAGREKKVISSTNLNASCFSTPVAANGVLYVLTGHALLAAEKQ